MGDYWKAAKNSLHTGVIAPALSQGRAVAEENGASNIATVLKNLSISAREFAKENTEEMTAAGRKSLEASITSGDFWAHPLRATALKAANMSAPLVASIVPGALTGGVLSASVATALAGGTLNAAQVTEELYKKTDELPDAELQKQSALYQNLRLALDETDARAEFNRQLRGAAPAINFLVGAAAGVVGPAGQMARGLKGGAGAIGAAERGALGRAGVGAAEGGVGMAAQGGVADASVQQALVDKGLQPEFNIHQFVDSILEGTYFGAGMGAGAGAAFKGHGAEPRPGEVPRPEPGVPAVETRPEPGETPVVTETPKTGRATAEAPKPAETAAVGNPESAPTRSETVYPKTKRGKKAKETNEDTGATVVEPVAPAPDQAVALAGEAAKPVEVTPQGNTELPVRPLEAAETPVPQAEMPRPAPEPAAGEIAPVQATKVAEPPSEAAPAAPVKPIVEAPRLVGQEEPAGGRILPDLSPEGKELQKAQKKALKANVKAAVAEPKEVGTKNYTQEEIAARTKQDEVSKRVVEDHVPEVTTNPTKPAEREMLLERLREMVEEAKKEIEIPQKPSNRSGELMLLRDAEKLISKKRVSYKELEEYLNRERLVRSGDEKAVETVRQARKAEGEMASRRDQGDVEKVDTSKSNAVGERLAESPEDILLRQETDEGEKFKFDSEKEAYAAGRERRPVVTKGPAYSTPVAPRAPVVVAKKGRQKLTTEERTKLARRANNDLQSPQRELTQAKRTPEEKPKTIVQRDREGNVTGTFTPIRTVPAREVLSRIDLSHLSGVPRALGEFLHKKLNKLAGSVKVHIVADADMDRMMPPRPGYSSAKAVHQLIMNGDQYVAIRASVLKDPVGASHIVMHELAHAVTTRAIHEDARIHTALSSLMELTRSAIHELPTDEHLKFAEVVRYAMTDPREFIAEAFSNPDVQEVLATLRLPERAAERLGLGRNLGTAWDAVVAVVRRAIEKIIGRVPEGHRMIEAIMRVSQVIERHRQKELDLQEAFGEPIPLSLHGRPDPVFADAFRRPTREDVTSKVTDVRTNVSSRAAHYKDVASTMRMLAQRAMSLGADYGEKYSKAVELKSIMERGKTKILEQEGGTDLLREHAEIQRKYGQDTYNEMGHLGFEATGANVNLGAGADNSHLGKDATRGWQAKARLPELNRRFAALPEDAQALLQRTSDFFKKMQDAASLEKIRNMLHAAEIDEPGLAERIHTDGLTDADKERFKTNGMVNTLKDTLDLRQLEGWYFPLRRYGDFVTTGKHELEAPKGALKVGDDTIQFAAAGDAEARRAARDFVESHDLDHVRTEKVWVDKNDHTQKIDASDVNAIPAYRVTLQTQHTEFHPTLAGAERAREVLQGEGLTMQGVRKREDVWNHSSDLMSAEMRTVMRSLEQQTRFQKMAPGAQDALRQALLESTVRLQASSRLAGSLQRRNVAGYSMDLQRVTADYVRQSAQTLGRLKVQPKLDEALSALKDEIEKRKHDKNAVRRDEMYNELVTRLHDTTGDQKPGALSSIVNRTLQASRLSRLAGPSFHIINAQEPWTTSVPVIGGRHGFGAATRAVADAYNTIGARGGLVSGLKDTARAFVKDTGFVDYVKTFKNEIAQSKTMGADKARRLQEVLDYLNDRGLFNNEAIFEVGRYADPSSNIAGRTLDRADLISNQLGTAIEAINRSVTALAEYNLEYKKNGGNHEAAMARALEVTADTMGDYSGWNSPKLMKSSLGKFAFQFKKFGLKTYYLLGKSFQGMIHGDAEAAKQFAGLMVTHAMVAGALGLPLEPFKVALMVSGWFGLTGTTWNDVENYVRQRAAEVLGAKGGEVFAHGLTRAIGVETSQRQGLDNLVAGLGSRSAKTQDIKAYLFDTIAGAPPGVLLDMMRSGQALAKGNIAEAVQYGVPIKSAHDIAKAVAGQSPKKNQGGRETMRALTPYETAIQALGFTPAAVAENYAKRNAFYSQSKDAKDARSEFYGKWAAAKGDERSRVWRQVEQWNAGKPREAKITRTDLDRNAKLRADELRKGTVIDGIRVTKRDRALYDQTSIYNTK